MQIELKASVYDALKAEAERVRGIGAFCWFRDLGHDDLGTIEGYDMECPVCINGMAVSAGLAGEKTVEDIIFEDGPDGEVEKIVLFPCQPWNVVGIPASMNDRTVESLITQGKYTTDVHDIKRVSWDDYVKELNIVRVPEDAEPGTGDHA